MTEKRRNLLIWIMVALFAIWIAAHTAIAATRYVNVRKARQKAEVWYQHAQQDAKPDMTADDAIRWLSEHGGGKALRFEKSFFNGREIEDHAIVGYQKMSEEGFLTEPMTAELGFHFDAGWRFTEVKLTILKYTLSWMD